MALSEVASLPSGDWTALLIGNQWPSSSALITVSGAAEARGKIAEAFEHYANDLQNIKHFELSAQEGVTAEDARGAFERGLKNSGHIAEMNMVKKRAYIRAHGTISELRRKLASLAEEGNSRIDGINKSKDTILNKVTRILAVVEDVQKSAAQDASACIGDLQSRISDVLTAQGIDASPQSFAKDNGLLRASEGAESSRKEDLETAIRQKLEQLNGTAPEDAITDTASGSGKPTAQTPANAEPPRKPQDPPAPVQTPTSNADAPSSSKPSSNNAADSPPPAQTPITNADTPAAVEPDANRPDSFMPVQSAAAPAAQVHTSNAEPPSAPGIPTAPATTPANPINALSPALSRPDASGAASLSSPLTAPTTSAPSIDAPSAPTTPTAAGSVAPQAPAAMTPDAIAQSFNTGNQTGAPVSVGAEAISTAAASPVHTAPPPPISPPLADAGAATSASPVFETAHAAPAPVADFAQTAAAPIETAQPVVATPAAAINPTTAIAAPPVSPGPVAMPTATPPSSLLAYGADLRPAAAAVPAAPVIPPSAVPGSAPVSPSSGAGPTGSPAVVRQQPTAPTAQDAAAAGLTERAFAATATGAALGAGSAHAAAQARLQRLLEAVARQQPQLCWAVGDLEEGGTLLVTDLAGGWVPPDVEIPTGVRLLQPGVRSGGLEAMLGSTTLTAAYRPGQYLTPATDAEPVKMSLRARDTAAVDDLGWAT